MNLFEPLAKETGAVKAAMPLAARMRPRTLDRFVGQEHILGPGRVLRQSIEEDTLSSAIFWGPAGCGKSTLAAIIAATTSCHFETFSAVTSGVGEVRHVVAVAKRLLTSKGQRTVLFVDEIHRFNKAQQDAFLPHVEAGTIILIGATTENPYFSVNAPLLSRSKLFRFESLSEAEVRLIVERALAEEERGLAHLRPVLEPEALDHVVRTAGGDARVALNTLEAAVLAAAPGAEGLRHVALPLVEDAAQRRVLLYDRQGDSHYDTISAYIKSMRGSDPDAAVYWLAKMLKAGEDPRFIARRLVIQAAEDVGNADPLALVVATAAARAVEYVGMPEAQIPLAQATIYVATAPKSNASYVAISRAMEDVEKRGAAAVPAHLRDASYPGAATLGHGSGYRCPHDFPGHYVEQEYVPPAAKSQPYYVPSSSGREAKIRERMDALRSETG